MFSYHKFPSLREHRKHPDFFKWDRLPVWHGEVITGPCLCPKLSPDHFLNSPFCSGWTQGKSLASFKHICSYSVFLQIRYQQIHFHLCRITSLQELTKAKCMPVEFFHVEGKASGFLGIIWGRLFKMASYEWNCPKMFLCDPSYLNGHPHLKLGK